MITRPQPRRRRVLIGLAVLFIVGGAGALAVRVTRSTMSAMADAGPRVPTARVVREALELTIHMTGEMRASAQQAITAPPVGGSLRILSLVDGGSTVKTGDVLLSFDPADQRYALEQAQSELQEAEQNILKRRADIGAQNASDQVALLTARFNVRRAELDAAVDRDLIPANDYQIRQVSLQEARRALEQTEQDVKARATVNTAGLSVLEETRMKAQVATERAQQNMEMLEIKAPIDGVVSVRDNTDSATVFFSGMTLPPYRVGDLVNPGRPVLDLFNVSSMEIRSNVNELDRVNLSVGQAVTVTSDSIAGLELPATVRAISGLGQAPRLGGPLRRFDVTMGLERVDSRLQPGTSVVLTVTGPRVEEALVVPRQAVFEREGKTLLYVRAGERFEPREVKVLHRGESRAAVEGVDAGTEVALIRPDDLRDDGSDDTPASGSAVPR
jgi:HlyD family secretion protein